MYRLAMIERVLERNSKNLIPQNIGQSPEWNPKGVKRHFQTVYRGKLKVSTIP
ncbi:MAG: hypothetical protein IPN97_04980 [Saprospiraceae bacterium]|nr:hypothetical protein [Saprospiraceae bacterium]